MKSPIVYYGGKGHLATRISEILPMNKAYIEPFAGSAAILLAREPVKYEVLNDLNHDVYNFWRVLRDMPQALEDGLVNTPYSKEEYLFCRDDENPPNDVEKARRFFVHANLAFGASTAKVGFSSGSFGRSNKALVFHNKVDRLNEVADRLRYVEVENMDAIKLIGRWNKPDVAMYLDPPYLLTTRVSKEDYATDNGSLAFHEQLIDTLMDFQGDAVLSGYPNTLYDTLGWRRQDIEVTKTRTRVECLWTNF